MRSRTAAKRAVSFPLVPVRQEIVRHLASRAFCLPGSREHPGYAAAADGQGAGKRGVSLPASCLIDISAIGQGTPLQIRSSEFAAMAEHATGSGIAARCARLVARSIESAHAGASQFKVMQTTRHKAAAMLAVYYRDEEIFTNVAGAGLLRAYAAKPPRTRRRRGGPK
jgi:hypothetical protein